jgi:uncharacterized membrane protein HdeD (DUF308 family)
MNTMTTYDLIPERMEAGIVRRERWPLRSRALLALVFGVVALAWRDVTLGEFVLVFGTYLFLDGVGALFCATAADSSAVRRAFLVEGIVCCAIGVIAYVRPFLPLALIYLIASWGIITGVLELVAAARMPRLVTSQWLLGLAGVSSIFLGMLLTAVPAAGAIAVVRVIAVYGLGFGAILFLASLRSGS